MATPKLSPGFASSCFGIWHTAIQSIFKSQAERRELVIKIENIWPQSTAEYWYYGVMAVISGSLSPNVQYVMLYSMSLSIFPTSKMGPTVKQLLEQKVN